MSFVRKITHQLVCPTTIYSVSPLHDFYSTSEQKTDDRTALSIGSMTLEESKKFSSTTNVQELGDYENIARQRVMSGMGFSRRESDINIPFGEYYIYAPVIGKMKAFLGDENSDGDEILWITRYLYTKTVLHSQNDIDCEYLKNAIETNPKIRRDLITAFVGCLFDNNDYELIIPLLKKLKPMLSQLVKWGAIYGSKAYAENPEEIEQNEMLLKYGLDAEAMNFAISRVVKCGSISSFGIQHPLVHLSFAPFAEVVLFCIPRGANINTPVYCNEMFGKYLHYYLSSELTHPVMLIQFLRSLWQDNLSGSQYHFAACDGYGRTPLLLAIHTFREDAALELLELERKDKIRVGIEKADPSGRTPLLIAAALGQKNVVEKLLKLGANPFVKDNNNGHDLEYYMHLSEKETADLLSPLLHPYRCTGKSTKYSKHSYLYWNDKTATPVCLSKKGEVLKTGDDQLSDLVVVSNHKDYIGRVHEAIQCAREEDDELADYFEEQLQDIEGVKPVIEICLENQKSVQQYLQSQEAQDLIVEWKRAEEKEYVSIPCVTNAANEYFTRLQGTLDDRNKPLVKKNSEGKILLPYFWLEQLRRHNPTAIKELSKNLGCAEEVLQIKPACSLAALAKPR